MKSKTPVFVYGTLRTDCDRAGWALTDKTLKGKGQTVNNYTLKVGAYPLATKEPTAPIVGELHEVSDEQLHRLDEIEGHPSYYQREEVKVLVDGREFRAWLYFINREEWAGSAKVVPAGDYRQYLQQRQRAKV